MYNFLYIIYIKSGGTERHRNDEIKDLLVKLSHSINDFRLSNYHGSIPKQLMSENEMSMLENALPLFEYLPDGRVRDIVTGQVYSRNESSVYLIQKADGEQLLVKSLKGGYSGCSLLNYK